MKRTNIYYWIFTGLFAAFMLFSSVSSILNTPEAIAFISTHLGYPTYFVPFIGVVKVLGIAAILVPGFPRLKEWAYAGLAFDLFGAIYSFIAVGDPVLGMLPMLIPIVLGAGSYYFHLRRQRVKAEAPAGVVA